MTDLSTYAETLIFLHKKSGKIKFNGKIGNLFAEDVEMKIRVNSKNLLHGSHQIASTIHVNILNIFTDVLQSSCVTFGN